MELDVAGVPCQDLNRPVHIRSVVSLDEHRHVISQRITERYPTERCPELRPEPSIAAAAFAVTGQVQLVFLLLTMLMLVFEFEPLKVSTRCL